jgi:hypothetical protein
VPCEEWRFHRPIILNNFAGEYESMEVLDLSKVSGKEFIEKHLTPDNLDILIRRVIQEAPPEKYDEIYQKASNKIGLSSEDIQKRVRQITLDINSMASPLEAYEAGAMSIDDFLEKEYKPRPFYLSPWLQPCTLAEIYGATGIGKTFLRDAIALSVTNGLNLGPWNVDESVGVLIFDGEMPCQSIQKRLLMLSNGLPERKSPLSIISSIDLQLQNYSAPNLSFAVWRDGLTDYLRKHPEFKILILDNVVSLFPGLDENSAKEWSPSNQWMLKLRSLGVALIKIHHPTKTGKTSRGTSLQRDNMDTIIRLQRPKGYHPKQGARFEVHFEKGRELYGDHAAPFIFQVIPDPSNPDKLTWRTEKIVIHEKSETNENVKTILTSLDKGMKQVDIAKRINCSSQHVSNVKKQAIKNGDWDKKGHLTDKGREKYCDNTKESEDE